MSGARPRQEIDRAASGDCETKKGDSTSLKVCLAASGGGHVRQILDLAPAWSHEDYFFITEDTALGRSIADEHPTFFVEHVALGQARLASPLRMFVAAVRNLIQSARIIIRERPQVLVTTGAGSVFFAVLMGRVVGAKVLVIESLARFNRLSAFARLAGPFAHSKVVQSSALRQFWPDAHVFDPVRLLSGKRPRKRPLLFATVGATLPFDRLTRMVAELKARGEIPEEVLFQVGVGGLNPDPEHASETLPFDQVLQILREADIVVCHGGTGSLITALREGCRVIAVPRLASLREHYDDHQSEITSAFCARGLISAANSVDELQAALREVRARPPVIATSEPTELRDFVSSFLNSARDRARQA